MNKEFNREFFDESSKAWRENKKVKGKYDRTFVYACQHQHKNGSLCKRDVFWKCGNIELLCRYHLAEKSKKERHKATQSIVEECSQD